VLIAAHISQEDGQNVLILGLQKENIERLVNDQPIEKDLAVEGVPGLEKWKVYILGPEDTVRFVAHYGIEGEGSDERG
jgi:hypothetical protein